MVSRGGGYVPAPQASLSLLISTASRDAATRAAVLRRKLLDDQKAFQAAQRAEADGDLRVASRLYVRVALHRLQTPIHQAARQRLSQIQNEAQSKVQLQTTQLAAAVGYDDSASSSLRRVQVDAPQVLKCFDQLDALMLEYAGVVTVAERIEEQVGKLRKNPRYAPILNEPIAAELWALGQEHEAQQRACCAVFVYEQAAGLAPAPSAALAKARLSELKADATIAATTEHCRDLQLCHENYRRAEEFIEAGELDRARYFLTQVARKAPADTSLAKAAHDQLAKLR
jgi:hypothetical protein